MKHLSIDLETYSSVPIAKAGAYKYIQSPDFEILLMAYSVDGGEVQIIDLAQGEEVPTWLLDALKSPDWIKRAYNAAFEWYCLSKFCGEILPIEQWRDTMLHGLYCGFTAGLEATGEAIGLPEDKRKLTTGKALIRYFCVPCKPTKSNGGRTRNLPKHDPDKWQLFKEYCIGDVVTEMEIECRLSGFPVPDDIQEQWQTDLIINSRGVAIDTDLIHGALEIAEDTREKLMAEAVELTGLENPNSVAQLSKWLAETTGKEINNLRKDTVARMLDNQIVIGDAARVLKIRQELGKTSTKKYDAIKASVCEDNRVRGLLQFYGASRTGRWCLTGDHEILTTEGWCSLENWNGGYIACWNPKGAMISFQKSEKVEFDYDGLMYEYNDSRICQKSTPDHKMRVKRQYGGNWIDDTVENMAKYRPSIPYTGVRTTNPGLDHNQLRVLVMTQADGHYTADGILRFHFKKQRKTERCKHLLRRAEIPFVESLCANNVTAIVIPSRHIPLWLRMFHDKTFGMWLLNESADIFFDELPNWDGYHMTQNSIQYCTCNKQNADVVMAFAHLSGRAAHIRIKDRSKQNPNWQIAYVVDIWLTPKDCHCISRKPEITDYHGKVFCAVTSTGYFLVRRGGKAWITGNSGRLINVQNVVRTSIDLNLLPIARSAVKKCEVDKLEVLFGSTMDTLSQLIRTSFIASDGNKLIDADFSSIEARVVAWLAKEYWVLDVFKTHGKIYEATAAQMFGVPIDRIKKGNPEYALRQRGKVATLALSYGGGANALIAMGALDMGIPEEDLTDIVARWRQANPKIVDLWYRVESAALNVVQTGRQTGTNGLIFAREIDYANGMDFLTITLLSGRKLYYAHPELTENRWGKPSIAYWGVDQTTKQWTILETYSGRLVENCVQAIARDCLAVAIQRLEAAGYPIVFHVHDEVVIDCVADKANLDDVVRIMTTPIPWAPDLPMNADGWIGDFFRKD